MPCFLPSKLPHLLPSPSSSQLSADDLASCFIEQMEISVFSLPPSFRYSGVSTFSLLLALELKMCLFYQMRPVPQPGLWIPFPHNLDPSFFPITNLSTESFLLD